MNTALDIAACFHQGAKIFGDLWILLIVDALNSKESRFNELQRAVNGVSPVTLANRLRKLESWGLVSRKEETVDKLSVTYSLTKKGQDMLPALREIQTYGNKYFGKAG